MQKLKDKSSRNRNGACLFELAYRLTNMCSVRNDLVLNPFLGTGTTILTSIASGKNSIGFEIDSNFRDLIHERVLDGISSSNDVIENRLKNHVDFVKKRESEKTKLKHDPNAYNFRVMTNQEKNLKSPFIKSVSNIGNNEYIANYSNSFEIELNNIVRHILSS
jgi:hypothetical protein